MKVTKEKRDPIVLPRDEDIALVVKMAPKLNPEQWGNWGYLIEAALVTGCREDELVNAARDDIDHKHKTLTVIGKGNKRRTIDLKAFDGYNILKSVPAFSGKEWLFWRTSDKRVRKDSQRNATFAGDRIDDPAAVF